MISLAWLEMKSILRRPAWAVFAALVALIGLATGSPAPESPGFFLEAASHTSWLTSSAGLSPIASLGEWGRFVLYLVGGVGLVPTSLLAAVLLTSTSRPEIDHRQVLWTTPVSSKVWALATKPVAASLVAIFSVVLGASSVLLHPAVREVLVPAGLEYVPMYILLAWIHILLWAAVSSCLFATTRSRGITLACVVSIDVGCRFLLPSVLSLWSQGGLVWRSYATYQFVSPFAPFGILLVPFLLRSVTEAALAIGLIGVTSRVRARLPEWLNVRASAARSLVVVGALLAVAAAGVSVWAIQRQIAPFALWELWRGQAKLDRPYVWSNDGRLLVSPGRFTVLRLPASAPTPRWVLELLTDREMWRYPIREVTIWAGDPAVEATDPELSQEKSLSFLRDAQNLIMIYPAGRSYPAELEGMVSRFLRQLRPLFTRATYWQRVPPELLVIGPADFLSIETALLPTGSLLASAVTMSDAVRAESKWWWIAWAMAGTAGLDEQARCYLTLFLMEGSYESQVRDVLAWLRGETEGASLHAEEQALRRLTQGETEVSVACGAPPPLCDVAWMKPEAAQRVLEHWDRGEEVGHEAYIRSLREGG